MIDTLHAWGPGSVIEAPGVGWESNIMATLRSTLSLALQRVLVLSTG